MIKDRVIWSNKNTNPQKLQVGLLLMYHFKESPIVIEIEDVEEHTPGILKWFDSHNIIVAINGGERKTCIPLNTITKLWVLKEKDV